MKSGNQHHCEQRLAPSAADCYGNGRTLKNVPEPCRRKMAQHLVNGAIQLRHLVLIHDQIVSSARTPVPGDRWLA
jgi:hypothetical protein